MAGAFAALPGVVADDDGVIQHAGGPWAEQRALAAGRAVVPRADRVVIEVAGADRLTWLDSITSQALGSLAPGESTELLVLDPQGRVEHAAAVLDDGASTWLIADRGDAAGLAKWLTMMRFRAAVTVAVRDDLAVVGAMRGGVAADRLVGAALRGGDLPLVWADPWERVSPGGWQYARAEEHPGADYAFLEALVDDAGEASLVDLDVAGALAAEALRIAAWRPRWAAEVDERSLPHESDWLRSAVHLDKGCYRGQETVAKVHNLGHPPRRLALLHLDGSENVLPARGDAVLLEDEEVGQVTSAAHHHELGPIALAILSRRAPEDAALVVRHDDAAIAAAQEIIVPGDAGRTAEVPRLTRLSRRRPAEA
ncbi:folate-binding protein YgfZ [Microbacterium sp. ZXX196]|uniref:CAF17-like 4Fe-4S cluster assembly/insertion protein YgfZ n=1 Tax=Microbacterium sp. ZXX196 TaxID=2609291 RepID=UPI0012B6D9DA|nr:glycine cleavage T C-terminal barrel domain-containing protein [Microbacterium sp. ZXX196]MTE23441.1 folate-binding protein [Microbacterium sp. ZXX196]